MARPTAPQPRTPRGTSRWHPTPVTPPPTSAPAEPSGGSNRPGAGRGRAGRERASAAPDRAERFAGDLDDVVVVRPEQQADAGGCACGCGGPGCWDPDTYISDKRPSEALADHRAAVAELIAAAGGVGGHPVGAVATGDDQPGDELLLTGTFPAGIDHADLDQLEGALEDLLDVGVKLIPVALDGH